MRSNPHNVVSALSTQVAHAHMLEMYQWLASAAGVTILTQIGQWREEGVELTSIAKRLRKQLAPEQARLALEMVDLRGRSCRKFSHGEQLWFTRIGLEQATSEAIASYKASRFPMSPCHDLCCGIGGDLMALAKDRQTIGWEREPVTAWLAAQNLKYMQAIYRQPSDDPLGSRVENGSVPAPATIKGSTWHFDPDRRPTAKRTTTIEHFAPGLDYIKDLVRVSPHGALKVAPATVVPAAWEVCGEREWIGEGRECKQQVVWFGDCARRTGQVAATVIDASQNPTMVATITDSQKAPPKVRNGIDRYLYEPHATVLAAGLRDALANEFGLVPLCAGHVLLTAERRCHCLLFTTFQILAETDLDRKSIHLMLDRHDVGEIELKPHGLEPRDKWRSFSFARRPGHRRTLWLLRLGSSYSAVLAQRLTPAET